MYAYSVHIAHLIYCLIANSKGCMSSRSLSTLDVLTLDSMSVRRGGPCAREISRYISVTTYAFGDLLGTCVTTDWPFVTYISITIVHWRCALWRLPKTNTRNKPFISHYLQVKYKKKYHCNLRVKEPRIFFGHRVVQDIFASHCVPH